MFDYRAFFLGGMFISVGVAILCASLPQQQTLPAKTYTLARSNMYVNHAPITVYDCTVFGARCKAVCAGQITQWEKISGDFFYCDPTY